MSYVALKNHSHYSILVGFSRPENIVGRASELDMGSIAMVGRYSLGGAVEFIKECKAKGVKPIIGCEIPLFYEGILGHVVILAKNLKGWSKLCEILHMSCPNGKPSPDFNSLKLSSLDCQDLILIDGGDYDSHITHSMFLTHENMLETEAFANGRLRTDWESRGRNVITDYLDAFGKENVFLGVDLFDSREDGGRKIITDITRDLAQKNEVPTVMVNSSFYSIEDQYEDHRVCLTIGLKKTMQSIYKNIRDGAHQEHSKFFTSSKFYIPSFNEIKNSYKLKEIENTNLISDMCDKIDLKHRQRIPKFSVNSDEDLTQLCRDNWLIKLSFDSVEKKKVYVDRIKKELETVRNALPASEKYGNLSDYFLIVHDYIQAAKNRGENVGIGRGSGGGSLINYLLGITGVDPVKYDLLFERFYNEGRNTADNVELPDIDADFEAKNRHKTIEYLKKEWGHVCVAQICNFSKIKGKSALKDVFRIKTNLGFDKINEITKSIPDEAAISDKLQDMLEETGESSIIRWVLQNHGEELDEYCIIKDDGQLDGEFAKIFGQAIRLEGTIRSRGRHASGIVISDDPLNEICPVWENSDGGELVTGMEMKSLSYMGIPKFDILGLSTIDLMKGTLNTVKERFREGVQF